MINIVIKLFILTDNLKFNHKDFRWIKAIQIFNYSKFL